MSDLNVRDEACHHNIDGGDQDPGTKCRGCPEFIFLFLDCNDWLAVR